MAQIQAAGTGNLGSITNTIISECRYTEEHNAPAISLFEQFNLKKGQKTLRIPKVEQMTAEDLTDGEDMIDSQEINASTVDATAAEVGLKVIITDKLVHDFNQDVFRVVGRQMGDAMARKKDQDAIALYSGFGTYSFGTAGKYLILSNASSIIAQAKANKLGAVNSLYSIHHPNAIWRLASDVGNTMATYPLPDAFNKPAVKDYWSGIKIAGVPFFEDGNISEDSNGDGVGFIGAKEALGHLVSKDRRVERERDASLRATEVVMTEDYGVFEIDDSKGNGCTYVVSDPTTTN